MPLRAASAAAAIGLVALVAALGVLGARHARHSLGGNGVRPFAFVGVVPAGQALCQPGETVPKGTAGLRMLWATDGKPTPRVDVTLGDRRGALAPGWREGYVVVPIAREGAERADVRLCIANRGPAPLSLGGENVSPQLNARIGAAPQPGRVRVEYEAAGETTWFAIVPAVADRLSIVRAALPGGASLAIWFALACLVVAGAVALVLREART